MRDKASPEGMAWYAGWLGCWDSICEAFPNAKPGATTCDVYADRLFDLEPNLLRAAVEQVICTHKYGHALPTIADIRDAARMLTEPAAYSSLEVWGATWREVLASYNEHRPMQLEPDVKALVDALGGRRGIIDSTKPGIERAQFLKAWERNQAEKERMRRATPIAREYSPEPTRLALPEPKPKSKPEPPVGPRNETLIERSRRQVLEDSKAREAGK